MVTCGRRSRIVTWTDWGAQGLGSVVRAPGLGDPQPSAWTRPWTIPGITRNGKQGPKSHCSLFSACSVLAAGRLRRAGQADSGVACEEPTSPPATSRPRRREPRAHSRQHRQRRHHARPEACGTRAQTGDKTPFWGLCCPPCHCMRNTSCYCGSVPSSPHVPRAAMNITSISCSNPGCW